jgi:hypothetical protein
MDTPQDLSLSDEEDELVIQIDETLAQTANPRLCLVGRFLTNWSYMMMEKNKTFWSLVKGVKI